MNNLVIGHPEVFVSQNIINTQNISISGTDISFGIVEADIPEFDPSLNPYKVLVKKLAFSCNFRDKAGCILIYNSCVKNSTEDNYIYSGFGSEFVAEIIEVGLHVTGLKKGDKVIPNGEYPGKRKRAQGGLPTNFSSVLYSIFDEEQLLGIPGDIDNITAASLTIAGQTVYSILRRADIKDGQSILMTAASSNTSLFAMETLKGKGVKTIGITSSYNKIETLINLGYDYVVISPQIDPKPLTALSNKLGGFDVVIDPFYDLYISHIIDYMNHFSKYFTCGLFKQVSTFESELESKQIDSMFLFKILVKNISIIGNCLGSTDDLKLAIADITSGKTKIVIDSTFEKDDYVGFVKRSFLDSNRLGKVVYSY